jgi:carboxylate-amine ligase
LLFGRTEPFAPEASPDWPSSPKLTADDYRRVFDSVRPGTIGVEEELMLLSPGALDLEPANERVLDKVGRDSCFRPELRASQIEIITSVCTSAAEIAAELESARRTLIAATEGIARIAAAGTHPFSADWGEVTAAERYRMLEDEYAWAARRSMVCGLHVHVAVGGAQRSLSVFNALRSFLPEIAALAANSPFFEGEDTGLCSIRPKLNHFPRTGVPPAFASWEEFTAFVDWGRDGGLFSDGTFFWWDLRPHPVHGTLELRAADSQTRVEDAAAIAAFVQCLAAWLAQRHDDGESLPAHEPHWIAENSWRAMRYGVNGFLVDLDSAHCEPTRERVTRLLDEIDDHARRLGCEDELAGVRVLLAGNGADRQRYVAEREGLDGLVRWLVRETQPGDATAVKPSAEPADHAQQAPHAVARGYARPPR